MAVDLGTAYISLVPTTKDFDKGIKSALDGTVKQAAKTGDAMGEKLSAGINSHLGKAGERSGDAFGRSFSPKVQSAGKSAMQGLANLMLGSAQGIGGEVGGTISAGLTGALNKGAATAIDTLDSIGTKGGAAMSSKLQTAGMIAAGGVALVGTAAIAATAELYKIGQAWDEIADGITAKTGAIGDRLDAITQSVKNVAVTTAAAPGDIAAVTAQLVQTLKLSGADLEMLTKQISDYNAMNSDAPLDIRTFGKAMRQFGVTSASDMSDQLDRLNNIAQNTGIPLNNLVDSLKTAAPVAKEFKMPLDTVTQLLATFEDAGLDASSAAGALRIALGNIAANGTGEAPVVQLQNIITKIQELYAAGDETGALDLAKSTFGKSFTQILPLIKENTLEVGNLDTAVGKLGPTIEEQRQATSDFTEEWRKFRNFLEVELAPVAETVFGGIQNFLSYTVGAIAQNIRDIRAALGALYDEPYGGQNMTTGAPLTPGIPAAPGILGGAAGVNPGIGLNAGGGGGNAASQILGGMAGTAGGNAGGVLGTAGRGYFNSRAAAAQLDARLVDQALLSRVPSGIYTQTGAADLTQGLADCSSAVEDLVNIFDGQSTAGRSLTTYNAPQWLASRGFQPGTRPGALNVGFNNTHMQATLPGGTPFNWGTSEAAAAGGVGGTGAFDPSFTQQWYRYDEGGILPPGFTLVENATGQNELVLNPEQQQKLAETLMHGAGGGAAPGPVTGVDPATVLHGAANGAAPGPIPQSPESPDYAGEFVRSLGFTPTAGTNTGYAGTSSLAKVIKMPSEFLGGLMDTAANLGSMAASAAIAAGAAASGGPAAAGAVASPALSYGFSLAAQQGKVIADYWLGSLPAIGADALVAQLFPFGAPRWLGYDYTGFAPQLGIQQAATTTLEKMGSDAIKRAFPQPGDPAQPGQIDPNTGMHGQMNGALPGPAPGTPPGPPPAPATVAPPPPEAAPSLPTSGPAPGASMMPSMMPNLFSYDEGGMLPPGGYGVNMTNRPEPVLTPQQWDAMSKIEPSGQQAPLVKIDAIYGMSPEDVASQIESKQKLAMMRYAGRP